MVFSPEIFDPFEEFVNNEKDIFQPIEHISLLQEELTLSENSSAVLQISGQSAEICKRIAQVKISLLEITKEVGDVEALGMLIPVITHHVTLHVEIHPRQNGVEAQKPISNTFIMRQHDELPLCRFPEFQGTPVILTPVFSIQQTSDTTVTLAPVAPPLDAQPE